MPSIESGPRRAKRCPSTCAPHPYLGGYTVRIRTNPEGVETVPRRLHRRGGERADQTPKHPSGKGWAGGRTSLAGWMDSGSGEEKIRYGRISRGGGRDGQGVLTRGWGQRSGRTPASWRPTRSTGPAVRWGPRNNIGPIKYDFLKVAWFYCITRGLIPPNKIAGAKLEGRHSAGLGVHIIRAGLWSKKNRLPLYFP